MTPAISLLCAFLAVVAARGQATPPLSAQDLRAPCVALVTIEEARSLGRKEALTRVSHDRPGSSICGWGPEGGSFVITLQTAEWFKYEGASGPKESFDAKRGGYDAVVGTDPVSGLGLEARVTKHERLPVVLVRREKDVIYVMCDCSREQTIAIAKLAAAPAK